MVKLKIKIEHDSFELESDTGTIAEVMTAAGPWYDALALTSRLDQIRVGVETLKLSGNRLALAVERQEGDAPAGDEPAAEPGTATGHYKKRSRIGTRSPDQRKK